MGSKALTEIISEANIFFLDIATKRDLLAAEIFFSWHKIFFRKKKNSCSRKKKL